MPPSVARLRTFFNAFPGSYVILCEHSNTERGFLYEFKVGYGFRYRKILCMIIHKYVYARSTVINRKYFCSPQTILEEGAPELDVVVSKTDADPLRTDASEN